MTGGDNDEWIEEFGKKGVDEFDDDDWDVAEDVRVVSGANVGGYV